MNYYRTPCICNERVPAVYISADTRRKEKSMKKMATNFQEHLENNLNIIIYIIIIIIITILPGAEVWLEAEACRVGAAAVAAGSLAAPVPVHDFG